MAEINGGKFGEGLSVAAINKLIISRLSELRDEKGKVIIPNDMLLWISAALGEAIGGSQGATIADSATKNNQLTKRQIEILNQAKDNGDKEVIEFLENLNLAQSYISGYLVGGDFDLDDPEKVKLAEAVMINAIQLGKVPTREDLAYVEGSLILAVVGGYGVYSHGGKVFKAAMDFSPVLTSGIAIEKISGNINFSQTASVHMSNINRFVPVQTLKDVINFSRSFPDPQGSTAKMFYSQMYKNGSLYNLEVLYDKTTNTIFHFKYTREALGPLQEIIK